MVVTRMSTEPHCLKGPQSRKAKLFCLQSVAAVSVRTRLWQDLCTLPWRGRRPNACRTQKNDFKAGGFGMATLTSITYRTPTVTSIGGRDGSVRSADGLIDLQVALPKEMGGPGGKTNPEELFAAGYAACFHR